MVREIIPTANISDKIHKSVDTKPCFYTFKNNLSNITSETNDLQHKTFNHHLQHLHQLH